ncbi:MAG: hypothetical protein FWG29_01020 [Treponema sp.]|nr:hypothetical protein [Treponema sp.]
MFAVQGIYNEGTVTIIEPVPMKTKYDVVVTFIKPVEQAETDTDSERKLAALNRITGILTDSSITLEEARVERLNRQ